MVAAGVGVVTYRVTGEALLLAFPVPVICNGCFVPANRAIRAARAALSARAPLGLVAMIDMGMPDSSLRRWTGTVVS
jgi:hypothetical protein